MGQGWTDGSEVSLSAGILNLDALITSRRGDYDDDLDLMGGNFETKKVRSRYHRALTLDC